MGRINGRCASLASVSSTIVALAGCSQFSSPKQVCLAEKTLTNVEALIGKSAIEHYPQGDLTIAAALSPKMLDTDALGAALASIWKIGTVKLTGITFQGTDGGTKKITCQGQLTTADGNATVTYAVQDTADGKDQVYTYQPSQEAETLLRSAVEHQVIQGAPTLQPAPSTNTAASPVAPSPDELAKDAALAKIPETSEARRSFDDFPATPYTGQAKLPDFKGAQKEFADFRSRIVDGIKEGANFAGDLRLIQFGCGTECTGAELANLQTGEMYQVPLGGEDNLDLTLTIHADSDLLKAHWKQEPFDKTAIFCVSQDFKWTGSALQSFPATKAKYDCKGNDCEIDDPCNPSAYPNG